MKKYTVVAGPCAIESHEGFVGLARELDAIARYYPDVELIIKGSFDKANRTNATGQRGVGLDVGIDALYTVKVATGRKVLTDIHESWQARKVADVVDVIQIPAFLGRQTDLIQAAAATGLVVNLKKPQWASVYDLSPMIEKAMMARQVWVTHRGTTFGPGNLVVPAIDLAIMASIYPLSGFIDVTHTNLGDTGNSIDLAVMAKAVGMKNFYAEVHHSPKDAISDSKNQLDISAFVRLLDVISP